MPKKKNSKLRKIRLPKDKIARQHLRGKRGKYAIKDWKVKEKNSAEYTGDEESWTSS